MLSSFCFFFSYIFVFVFGQRSYRQKKPEYIYDLVRKGVHENRTKGVENKVDDTLKLVSEIFADKGHKRLHVVHQILQHA